MTLTIRLAGKGDLPVIVEFNQLLALETEGLKLDGSTLQEGVRALLDDPAKGIYYLAEAEGRVVGQTMITYEWSDWRNGNYWWLQSVYVAKEFRGRGVFRSLFLHVCSEATRAGARALRLYSDRENRSAQDTYSRLGMKKSGYEMFEMEVRPPAG